MSKMAIKSFIYVAYLDRIKCPIIMEMLFCMHESIKNICKHVSDKKKLQKLCFLALPIFFINSDATHRSVRPHNLFLYLAVRLDDSNRSFEIIITFTTLTYFL